jgi:hypothetical protein
MEYFLVVRRSRSEIVGVIFAEFVEKTICTMASSDSDYNRAGEDEELEPVPTHPNMSVHSPCAKSGTKIGWEGPEI